MKNRNKEWDNGSMWGIFWADVMWFVFSLGGHTFGTMDFAMGIMWISLLMVFFYLLDNGKIV